MLNLHGDCIKNCQYVDFCDSSCVSIKISVDNREYYDLFEYTDMNNKYFYYNLQAWLKATRLTCIVFLKTPKTRKRTQ